MKYGEVLVFHQIAFLVLILIPTLADPQGFWKCLEINYVIGCMLNFDQCHEVSLKVQITIFNSGVGICVKVFRLTLGWDLGCISCVLEEETLQDFYSTFLPILT